MRIGSLNLFLRSFRPAVAMPDSAKQDSPTKSQP